MDVDEFDGGDDEGKKKKRERQAEKKAKAAAKKKKKEFEVDKVEEDLPVSVPTLYVLFFWANDGRVRYADDIVFTTSDATTRSCKLLRT
jgi:hypothetical protein